MRILINAGYTKSLINFRGDLIKQIISNGHEVVTTAPEEDVEGEIGDIGADFIRSPIKRTAKNPIRDIEYFLFLMRIIRKTKFDVVLSYTIKPVIYGSIAAKISNVGKIASIITGTSFLFEADKGKCVQRVIAKVMYWGTLRFNDAVFFQNKTDAGDMVNSKMISEKQIRYINGSGVNLEKYSKRQLAISNVFLMIARLLREKGVIEFISAAKIVNRSYPYARFLLAGPFDENSSGLKHNDIESLLNDSEVEYLGELEDVRPAIAACRVFVLPSYREGTPRTVLEAMAMGRAIITTDTPGCRETVINGQNGILIPPKDAPALALAMTELIRDSKRTERMAEKSYEICKEKFDVKLINNQIINELGLE